MLAALAMGTASCSKDYLEVSSEKDLNTSQIFANTDMLDGAVNGLAQIMCEAYSSDGYGMQGYNGEATISLWYGSYRSGDAQYSNCMDRTSSYTYLVTSTNNEVPTYHVSKYPWVYYYMLISNANAIIDNAYGAAGSQSLKDFYVAQALTCRAHAYTQLVGLYSKRWVDSRNGASRGVPLRLDEAKGSIACSSLGQVYEQIYTDLDRALELYEGTTASRGNKLWRPDASIAHGVYSRAALAKQDWATAASHAKEARKGYGMMNNDDYWSGFNTANKEWMWETYVDDTEDLGVYGFFAYVGSNTTSSKGYKNIGTMSKDLADQIPAADTRKELFIIPQPGEETYVDKNGKTQNAWKREDSGTIVTGTPIHTRIIANYIDRLTNSEGTVSINKYLFPYMSTKFLCIEGRSLGNVCLMRAAEMIYNEAEALCMQGGHDTEVQNLLKEAVKAYQPSYSCTKTGAALLDEVKLYKRFDLWGEGRAYFDQKRWNIPMVRKSWADGGNWHPTFAGTGSTGGSYGVGDRNNWCICIPEAETNYNELINANIEPEGWTVDGNIQ